MTSHNLKKNKFTLLLLFILLTACDSNTMYHSFLHLPKEGWKKSDTLTFKAPITDSLATFRVSVEVRNRDNYPYSNLYLFISHNTQDSTAFVTDTVKYTLADKTGKWLGTGLGDLFQSACSYTFVAPRRSGNLIFKVAHGMSDNNLVGINDIGLEIKRER
jgi:gliding motility-associated lipoprotein GldH